MNKAFKVKKIEFLVYLFIIFFGILISFFYNKSIDKAYNNLCEISMVESKKELKTNVSNLILLMDSYRTNKLNYNSKLESDRIPDFEMNEQIKSEIHDLVLSLIPYKNQYFWVNEVLDYDGGDNYAIRFIHQNLTPTEGLYLSTNTIDLIGNKPYEIELEEVKRYGETFQSYYFKNLLDDNIEEKLSYATLYEPYNWIVASGIPYSDMFQIANSFRDYYKATLPIFYLVDFALTLLGCLVFGLYIRKKDEKAQKLLAIKQSEFKSNFLATMSHDLRTPMNAIVGLAELAQDKDLSKQELSDYVKNINISSKYLLTLINDILDISAIESGKLYINENPFDVKDFIHSLISLYLIKSKESGINFIYDCHDIKFEILKGDAFRINQIISNLLSNSFKFTERGGTVSLEVFEKITDNEKVKLEIIVSDDGCGMTQKQQEKIFQRFEQADSSIKNKYGGSGLGLSIVKQLTQLMNGSIKLVSSPSKGTKITFSIELNVINTERFCELSDKRNLLIIDDELTCRTVEKYANDIKLECISCFDKATALELINGKDEFGYILISYKSKEFAKILIEAIQLRYPKGLPIIIFTLEAEESKTKNKDIHLVLNKPIFESDLYSVLCEDETCKISQINPVPLSLEGMKILVVEDNVVNQLVTRKIIESNKGSVYIAEDGKQAVDMFESNSDGFYHLILMDCEMPIMNGFEATKKIRSSKLSYASTIPIYSMTANTTTKDIEACYNSGMNGYLSKPIDISTFNGVLMDLWDKKNRV